MSEIKYEIIKQIGTLSRSVSGWAKVCDDPNEHESMVNYEQEVK